jgi:uncharacterized C2H2 Zn-finger protein
LGISLLFFSASGIHPAHKIGRRVLCANDFKKIMGLFSRKKEIIVGNICPKCDMEFADSERTLRHMEKAHQSKKKFECNSCG